MTARERAAGILGPKKLRQLEDAGLKVVDGERTVEGWVYPVSLELYADPETSRLDLPVFTRQSEPGKRRVLIVWEES